jgi:hypothetical protein
VSSARALCEYKDTSEEELSLQAGQLVVVIRDKPRFFGVAHSFCLALQITEKSDGGWWRGKCGGKEVRIFWKFEHSIPPLILTSKRAHDCMRC